MCISKFSKEKNVAHTSDVASQSFPSFGRKNGLHTQRTQYTWRRRVSACVREWVSSEYEWGAGRAGRRIVGRAGRERCVVRGQCTYRNEDEDTNSGPTLDKGITHETRRRPGRVDAPRTHHTSRGHNCMWKMCCEFLEKTLSYRRDSCWFFFENIIENYFIDCLRGIWLIR